jgi:ubiquinone/menaquinone biosynthesis C-methylase UbiE
LPFAPPFGNDVALLARRIHRWGMEPSTTPNAEAIEAWDTVLFDKFCRFRHLVTRGLSTHGDAALARCPPGEGARAIDLGCGFGDTAVQMAQLVGERGQVLGVDGAPRFIEAATREAEQAGIANVRFAVADVQMDPLEGPHDYAFARFGTMFFANPVQAFRNVRRSLAPGSKLCFVVWRKREDNPWLHRAEVAVRQLVEEPEQHDAPTCGPGPFSMADADLVSTVLLHSGFGDVALHRHDAPICIGSDLGEALELAMALGPAGEVLRLAGEDAERQRPVVEEALRGALAEFETQQGVYAPSSTWIVTAAAE